MSSQVEFSNGAGFTDPSQTLSGPIVGIIYPPPEVRSKLAFSPGFLWVFSSFF